MSPSTPRAPKRFPLDPDGRVAAILLALIFALGFLFAITWLWVLTLILLVIVCGFFRDPPRRVPRITGAVVSPADGKIVAIETNQDPRKGPVDGPCISIFLSIFNVHVNRCPVAGRIDSIQHQPGGFRNALKAESAIDNDSIWVRMRNGPHQLVVRQIAGAIARRCVCRLHEGQTVRCGQRLGIIRFGSRTELYLPPEARVQAELGQHVKGGVTVLAYLPEERSEGE